MIMFPSLPFPSLHPGQNIHVHSFQLWLAWSVFSCRSQQFITTDSCCSRHETVEKERFSLCDFFLSLFGYTKKRLCCTFYSSRCARRSSGFLLGNSAPQLSHTYPAHIYGPWANMPGALRDQRWSLYGHRFLCLTSKPDIQKPVSLRRKQQNEELVICVQIT